MIVRLAQNNVNNMISDAGVKSQITFDDVYWGDDGRKNTHQIEGRYSNRANDSGGLTILRLLKLLWMSITIGRVY